MERIKKDEVCIIVSKSFSLRSVLSATQLNNNLDIIQDANGCAKTDVVDYQSVMKFIFYKVVRYRTLYVWKWEEMILNKKKRTEN